VPPFVSASIQDWNVTCELGGSKNIGETSAASSLSAYVFASLLAPDVIHQASRLHAGGGAAVGAGREACHSLTPDVTAPEVQPLSPDSNPSESPGAHPDGERERLVPEVVPSSQCRLKVTAWGSVT